MHRFGPAVSLTAKSLQVGGGQIYAADGGGLAELDGQLLLGLGEAEEDPEEIFAAAEAAEAAGAARRGGGAFRALPGDRSGGLGGGVQPRQLPAGGGPAGEAERELARAVSLDPGFVEAWFNLAGLVAARGPGGGGAASIWSGR